ncbi:MAG TPA: acyl-CoA dehydrogenase, partial [Thiolinea sp.]|nr:acyl-CoA dehydrogenase [Thiolinea sp.]
EQAVADKYRRYVDLLMPVAKGWCTEVGNEVCDDAIQVFGGMGFVEETGIAQYFRDARIITIYEGTTGIQANDLIGRKILREKGATLYEVIADMQQTQQALNESEALKGLAAPFQGILTSLQSATEWVLTQDKTQQEQVLAAATPFLYLLGTVCGAWQLARLALAAESKKAESGIDSAYCKSLINLAEFYFCTFGVQARAYAATVKNAGPSLSSFKLSQA